VTLHGRLGQIEDAADRLIAFALHHQRQDFALPLGKAEIGRRFRRARRQFGADEDLRRDIDAAGEDQPQRVDHDFARCGFGDEAERAEIERLHHILAVMEGRQDDDGNRRVAAAQLGQHRESIAIGKVQIEQNQLRLLGDQLHRLAAIGRFQHPRLGLELFQHARERVTDQRMIVDEENFHDIPRLPQGYVTPGGKSPDATVLRRNGGCRA